MRLNRSRTAAVLALAGICFCFLGGCGSQQKASQPPAMPAPNTEKTAAEPDVASPGTKTLDATGPESPVLKTPKPEKDLGLKQVKKATPPKAMARPTQAPKITSSLPGKEQQKINPMRHAEQPPPETNPAWSEESIAEERAAFEAAHSARNTEMLKSRQKDLEESEGEADVEPDMVESAPAMAAAPGAAETSPPAPPPGPGSGEPQTTEAKSAPEDINEFIKMAQDQKDYTVVKVYYGTDRAALTDVPPKQPVYLSWLTRTVIAGASALFLWIMGSRFYPSRLLRVLAYCGMFVAGLLAGLTIYAQFQAPLPEDMAKSLPAASVSYGPDRGKLEFGACEVSIPKSHEVGELESPSVLRLEFREDPSRHVVLLGIQPEPATVFRGPKRVRGALEAEIGLCFRARL